MKIIGIFRAAAIAVIWVIGAVSASNATEVAAKTALNVRSGPGTNFWVVDTLTPGEIVRTTECVSNGWCYIEHPGPDGWVSSNYLTTPSHGSSVSPNCSLTFIIGSGGPSLAITCGDNPVIPFPVTPPVTVKACFYEHANYTGANFCMGPGQRNSVGGTFNDRISSIQLFGGAKVKICEHNNMAGICRIVHNDRPLLGGTMNDRISSMKVYQGGAPAPYTPQTHSTGQLVMPAPSRANLDNGMVGGSGTDIWYWLATPANKRLTARNGAQFAVGDRTNRGYSGCSVANYTNTSISLSWVPVGSYICVRTSQGRISQIRVNGCFGTTLRLGYTTWAN